MPGLKPVTFQEIDRYQLKPNYALHRVSRMLPLKINPALNEAAINHGYTDKDRLLVNKVTSRLDF